jgi:S-DNA-T family DNA segregation ATPase FtsK/SpoIIIE
LTPVIKDTTKAIAALNWVVNEMENRYKLLENFNVRNINGYQSTGTSEGRPRLPYILVIIDEFADLMMIGKKDIEDPIIRLASMARAVGIHLVLATQRPSADVITGLIKANFPGRIAFKVSGKLESRIILDINGAESLLGKGDMLYASPEIANLKRIQSPFISDDEVFRITDYFKNHYQTDYLDEIVESMERYSEDGEAVDPEEEPLFEEARDIVINERKSSASYLQRRLKIGYNRASRIIEMMEEMGIIGPQIGARPREILVD